jgi:hypothetical protein
MLVSLAEHCWPRYIAMVRPRADPAGDPGDAGSLGRHRSLKCESPVMWVRGLPLRRGRAPYASPVSDLSAAHLSRCLAPHHGPCSARSLIRDDAVPSGLGEGGGLSGGGWHDMKELGG